MSKCMMCQQDEDLRDAYEREEKEEESVISDETRKDIKKLKSFSFYLVVIPIIIFLTLVLIFVI